jgi:cyclophilin family peptidyl-prolyl cis-trans isomerase
LLISLPPFEGRKKRINKLTKNMTFKSPILLLMSAFALITFTSASGCNASSDADTETITDTSAEVKVAVDNVESTESTDTNDLKDKEPTGTVKVKITTSMGDMIVLLYDDTPVHRDNFVKLVEEGYYDGLLWHRVIPGFMIQGGDPNSKGAAPGARLGSGGPGYTLPAEIQDHLYHKKGALSAARQGDAVNPQKESSGSQFYVVQGKPMAAAALLQNEKRKNARRAPDNQYKYSDQAIKDYETFGGTAFLDDDYTVFGEVIEGLDVLDAIAATQTAPGDRPVEDVTMSMEIIK